MSAFYDLASLVVVPSGYKSGKVYAQKPLTTDGQLAFTRASTATRVNASGLVEAVASGVPRLDYLNSTCPKLLLEPQRSNINTYSQDFTNAASWSDLGAGLITATANFGVAPDGTTTSTQIVFTSASQIWRKSISGLVGNTGVFSLWIKGTPGQTIAITYGGNSDKVVTLGTGWNRFNTDGNSGTLNEIFINTFLSATARTIEVWGGQVELAAYATSYIPTTTAAVTRVADAASKTGISSLIGQTEGTLYWEGYVTPLNNWNSLMSVEEIGNYFFNIRLNTTNKIEVATSGFSPDFVITASTGVSANTYYKIAGAYKSGQSVLYVNGVQIGTSAVTFTIPLLSQFRFNVYNVFDEQKSTAQALLFKTRLTNAQLAELTAL